VKVSTEKLEGSQVVLNVELDPDEIERALQQAYRRLVTRLNIPGFRKGKAPRPMVERHLGKEAFLDEALEHAIPEFYDQAIEQYKVDAIARPQIEIVQRSSPTTFKATVAVAPTIELSDYHQVRMTEEPVEVTPAQVEEALEQLRQRHALWEPVERPAAVSDRLTMDVEGKVDGRASLNEKGIEYLLQPERAFPVPGFAQQLEGIQKGEERQFSISFPAEEKSELAGKEHWFKVTVHEIKEKRLPALDDTFAKGVGQGFDSLEALRQQMATDLKAKAEQEARVRLEDKLIEAVAEQAKVDLPQVMIENEVEQLINDQKERLGLGQMRLEDYLKIVKKTDEELRNELRPSAQKRVIRGLVLGKVAERESIQVLPEEVDAEIEVIAQAGGEKREELRKALNSPDARRSIENLLLTRKTKQRLVDIASGNVPTAQDAALSLSKGGAGSTQIAADTQKEGD